MRWCWLFISRSKASLFQCARSRSSFLSRPSWFTLASSLSHSHRASLTIGTRSSAEITPVPDIQPPVAFSTTLALTCTGDIKRSGRGSGSRRSSGGLYSLQHGTTGSSYTTDMGCRLIITGTSTDTNKGLRTSSLQPRRVRTSRMEKSFQ